MPTVAEAKLSGLIKCSGVSFERKGSFRTAARRVCDDFFPEEASQPTDLIGSVYRQVAGRSTRVNNTRLTWKEKLFGEYGPKRNYRAQALYYQDNVVSYKGLTEAELDFLKKVLSRLGMEIQTDLCTVKTS